jgi:hypothetical protein
MTHRVLFPIAAALAVMLSADAASAFTSAPRPISRLRPRSSAARTLLVEAQLRSTTVRALVDDLESTDVIVHVGFGRSEGGVAASTVFVTATEHARYLRITIDTMTSPHDVIPLLAHELEHALEIARHPEVRDVGGMRRLYVRIGLYARIGLDGRTPAFFETDGARAIERRVRAETFWARTKQRDLP